MNDEKLRDHNLSVYKELGFFGLKTLLALNGGAIIVVLTFLGNSLGSEHALKLVHLPLLEAAITAFLLGILFCFLAAFSNMFLAVGFTAEPDQIPEQAVFALLFWLSVPAITSLAFFSVGVFVSLAALQ